MTSDIWKMLWKLTNGSRQVHKTPSNYPIPYLFICTFRSNGFYGIQRGKNFNPNHWMEESPLKQIRKIEEDCQNIMKILNYTKGAINVLITIIRHWLLY